MSDEFSVMCAAVIHDRQRGEGRWLLRRTSDLILDTTASTLRSARAEARTPLSFKDTAGVEAPARGLRPLLTTLAQALLPGR